MNTEYVTTFHVAGAVDPRSRNQEVLQDEKDSEAEMGKEAAKRRHPVLLVPSCQPPPPKRWSGELAQFTLQYLFGGRVCV